MSKTASGLVAYAASQLGKPYWWGTFGQTASASLYSQKKAQYPSYYTATDFSGQYGQRVHDCVGLMKGYRWSDTPTSLPSYVAAQDVAVGGLYNQCGSRGTISSMPMEPGVCVFMSDMSHVGVYIGDGYVVEARGHAYGVVKTALSGRGWGCWGKPDWISYDTTATGTTTTTTATTSTSSNTGTSITVKARQLKSGCSGTSVKRMQQLLIALGYTCGSSGADGDFGSDTLAAVKKFQAASGLTADGIVGALTWAALLGA